MSPLIARNALKSNTFKPLLISTPKPIIHHHHYQPFSTTPSLTTTTTTTTKMTYEFLVSIPDHPNSLSKRLAARPAHLAALKPHIESGKVVFGGATLSAQPKEGEAPDMTGSVMLIKADSREELMKFLEGDEYVKGGTWDMEKATITPFRCAVRTAL